MSKISYVNIWPTTFLRWWPSRDSPPKWRY